MCVWSSDVYKRQVLVFISKYAIFKPVIDTSKCNSCGLCARNCKASCINPKAHEIDYSRCVTCMDCIGKCKHGAITYTRRKPKNEIATSEDTKAKSVTTEQVDNARRSFLSASAIFATTSVLKAQEKKVDGGLATIEDKKIPQRENPIYPPGALSARNFTQHCTACQLCVSVCPNQVLRPSDNLLTLMQPEMSYTSYHNPTFIGIFCLLIYCSNISSATTATGIVSSTWMTPSPPRRRAWESL